MPSADSIPPEENADISIPPFQPPLAPLTPGPRARGFLELYQKTLSTTIRTVSYENFSACFPTIAERAPENLRGLHKAMIERLDGLAKKDFADLLKERNVMENLNALEELISDAQRRKARAVDGELPPTPPHLLSPAALLHAHLSPHLASSQSQLNARLQTVQSQNASLFETIQAQRREIEALVEGLESTVQDLQSANEGLNGEVVGLRQVAREAEVEMGGL